MEEIICSQNINSTIFCYSMDFSGISKQNAHGGWNVLPKMFVGRWWYFLEKCWKTGWSEQDVRDRRRLPWMATVAVPVRIRTATHFSLENSHRETSHRGRTFRSPWTFVEFTATLRYEPCIQFINVSQRRSTFIGSSPQWATLFIRLSAKNAANLISYRGVRRITAKIKTVICEQAPNHGSYFAYARLIARVNSQFIS